MTWEWVWCLRSSVRSRSLPAHQSGRAYDLWILSFLTVGGSQSLHPHWPSVTGELHIANPGMAAGTAGGFDRHGALPVGGAGAPGGDHLLVVQGRGDHKVNAVSGDL